MKTSREPADLNRRSPAFGCYATTHTLKTWPVYFDALWTGDKTFEVRKNDRNYMPGDKLLLQEYDPGRQTYLDRELHADVTYRMPGGRWGLAEGYCIMSLKITKRCWKQSHE